MLFSELIIDHCDFVYRTLRRSPAAPASGRVTQSSLADNLATRLLSSQEATASRLGAAAGRGIDLDRQRREERDEREERDRRERLERDRRDHEERLRQERREELRIAEGRRHDFLMVGTSHKERYCY